eukprot:scaffold16320_cov44-Cyclotella_meneghiniana.AAC.1
MQQSARIEGEIMRKIQQIFDLFVADHNQSKTQQPTGYTENEENERMRWVGEEGDIASNTTINQEAKREDGAIFFVVLLVCTISKLNE